MHVTFDMGTEINWQEMLYGIGRGETEEDLDMV